jgi:hypothetical protein
MYNWTPWLDQAWDDSTLFYYEDLGNGKCRITRAGVVQQLGTEQDALHFNNIEGGIVDAHVAIGLLVNALRQTSWRVDELEELLRKHRTVEVGTVTLTNSLKYPFNNSERTIALVTPQENSDYIVDVNVTAQVGGVEEIIVSSKLTNGFKMAFTGGGTSCTVKYIVVGGFVE